MTSREATGGALEMGARVWTHGAGAEPSGDRVQRRAGVIIDDCGAQYTAVRGADGKPLVRRWAVHLDDGVLVFRHDADLEVDACAGSDKPLGESVGHRTQRFSPWRDGSVSRR